MKRFFKLITMCFSMFTIFSLPCKNWDEDLRKDLLYVFPLVGVYLSIIFAVLFFISVYLYNKYTIYLFVAVLSFFSFYASGFIHLDGFMDVSDAIGSCGDKNKILDILKDSHVGSFAVINIVVLFFVQYLSMYGIYLRIIDDKTNKMIFILNTSIILILSRIMSSIELLNIKTIKKSEYNTDRINKNFISYFPILVLIFTFIISMILTYVFSKIDLFKNIIKTLIVILLVIFSHLLCSYKCYMRIGGINGDVSGYSICISECIGLIVILLL